MLNKEKKTPQKCQCDDPVCKIQQRIFEREVDEELRQEHLIQLWKKYRFMVYGLVVCVILGTMFSEWYSDYQMKVRVAESDRYENAIIAAVKGDKEMAVADLKLLGAEGKTGYKYLAELKRAGILIQMNKGSEGLAVLKKVIDDTNTPKALHDAAVIAYVGGQVDFGNTAELKQALKPILADVKSPFLGNASELMAVLQIISGEKAEAVKTIETALGQPNVSGPLAERLNTILKEIKK